MDFAKLCVEIARELVPSKISTIMCERGYERCERQRKLFLLLCMWYKFVGRLRAIEDNNEINDVAG